MIERNRADRSIGRYIVETERHVKIKPTSYVSSLVSENEESMT